MICAIALSLAYPVREYIGQRQQIDQLLAAQQSISAQVKNLQAEQQRYADPAYIEQQARDQLHMLPDREVLRDHRQHGRRGRHPSTGPARWLPGTPKLWQSVKKADQAPAR